MENLVRVLLVLHIVAGFAAFFCAPVALLTLKGGKTHRRFGKYYFWLMAVVAASGAVIAAFRPIFFLAMIAVFSFYFSFRGYRVLLNKGRGAQALDWLFAIATLAASAALLAIGILQPAGMQMPGPAISIFFGLLGLWTAGNDVYGFVRASKDKNAWWYDHMSGMLGSYLAAVSAFSAVNLRFIPMPWRWLWPTLVGGPLIFVWIGYYHRKFDRKRDPAAAATGTTG
jgi:hypothetical protein